MGFSNAAGALARDAMHRLPGMPDHARAGELNAQQDQRSPRNRSLRNQPLRNRPLGSLPMHNPDGRHGRQRRLLAGWQTWIGQRFCQGQR
jgi:hypothetical protein